MPHLDARTLLEALVAVVVFLVLLAVGFVVLRRVLRRRWRRVRVELASLIAAFAVRSTRAGFRWWLGRRAWDARRRAAYQTRRQLWRAVTSAEAAVSRAKETRVPIGDLPALCRQLRNSASAVDCVVQIASLGSDHARLASVNKQVDEVLATARNIATAAGTAISEFSAPALRSLVEQTDREARALWSGLARAREVLTGSDS